MRDAVIASGCGLKRERKGKKGAQRKNERTQLEGSECQWPLASQFRDLDAMPSPPWPMLV